MARIDDAVRRILTVKFELGLFEHPYADPALLRDGRLGGPPRPGPRSGGEVAGAAEER